MTCKVCDNKAELKFKADILNKYSVGYYQCSKCGYLFTEEPYWLEEAYKSAINLSDTGILERNKYFARIVSVLIHFFFRKDKQFVDYAGGYGIFTRLMRDTGFDFYWKDEYCQNLLAKGFEFDPSTHKAIEAITAFEVFEHFINPVEEINKMLKISETIIFSTVLLPDKIPGMDWWYYGFEHGQHLSFYSIPTLQIIAQKFNLNLYSCKGLHILTKKKLSPLLLKTLLSAGNMGLFSFLKLRMKSRTWDDHLKLKEEI